MRESDRDTVMRPNAPLVDQPSAAIESGTSGGTGASGGRIGAEIITHSSSTRPAPEARFSGLPAVAFSLIATLAWIVAWYWPTAREMASIWLRSDTFAHGLVVLPIIAWLVWDKRHHLDGLQPRPISWLALPAALAGFGWMLGVMVSVNALAFVALASLIVTAWVGVLGWRLAFILAFPILFLFFGVPIGEFLMPALMDWTADFTVRALRLSGVPVYQEGLFFIVPNGRWSVVEACSGLRYLIASLMVGTLFAYLNYRSLSRRLMFVAVAIIVPIIANWMRAYLIVMLGYLSDNTLAAGVDHLIYGWVFFGIVILLMFWIGARWREEAEPVRPLILPLEGSRPAAITAVLPILVVTALFPIALRLIESPVPEYTLAVPALEPAAQWVEVAEPPVDYRPFFRGYRGDSLRHYRHNDGTVVGVYVAYYADQRRDAELVAWGNGLIAPDQDDWRHFSTRRDALADASVWQSVVGTNTERVAVWHWYQTRRGVVASKALAKAYLALDHLTGQADDAAFIAVFVPFEERTDSVRKPVETFISAHADQFSAWLFDTRRAP